MEDSSEDTSKSHEVSQEGSSKRSADTIYLKVLVPSIAAGAIIGKNGEAIGQMQKETGAKIKLSKLNDFYPGTTERVCLIQGSLNGVRAMHNYIMERILEKPEISAPALTPTGHIVPAPLPPPTAPPPPPTTYPPTAASSAEVTPPPPPPQQQHSPLGYGAGPYAPWSPLMGLAPICPPPPPPPPPPQPLSTNRLLWERHKQVKILVPNCTAGLVIGKQGSYVSEIKEVTGAFIQISQKSKDINLPERCITIAGEADQLRAAVDMVLTKIAEDPQSGTCPTISYAHAQGPVASAYPTGSPFAYTSSPPPLPPPPGAPTAPPRQKVGAADSNNTYYCYFAAAAAAAAAAAEYQQRLFAAAANYQLQAAAAAAAAVAQQQQQQQHSGDASGASSSLESAVGALTPPPPPGEVVGGPPPASPTTAIWLRSRGYSEEAVAEITQAMSTLSAHGVFNVPPAPGPPMLLGAPPPPHHAQVHPHHHHQHQQMQILQQQQQMMMAAAAAAAMVGTGNGAEATVVETTGQGVSGAADSSTDA